jgi:serine protease Do
MDNGRRRDLLSYLMVGLVGAIIGGLLVVGIAPGIIMHRAGLVPTVAESPGSDSGQPFQPSVSTSEPSEQPSLVAPQETIAHVAEKVSPAVVGIVNKSIVRDFFGRQFLNETSGSGLIITEDGYIVTNNHVVDNSTGLTVFLADGRMLDATVVGTDSATDLAVIKIEAEGLPIGVFGDSDKVRPGQIAVAIGNPLGMEFNRSVTAGVVSGLNRVIQDGDFNVRTIQTDAVINPGNSGGPLVNAQGEVIGLTSIKISTVNVEGMGFAIPANLVKRIADDLIETGKVRRAYLGVTPIDKDISKLYGLGIDVPQGVYIYDIQRGHPADKAGLKKGDIILEFEGVKVDSASALHALMAERRPGDTVNLRVLRDDETFTFTATLAEWQDHDN